MLVEEMSTRMMFTNEFYVHTEIQGDHCKLHDSTPRRAHLQQVAEGFTRRWIHVNVHLGSRSKLRRRRQLQTSARQTGHASAAEATYQRRKTNVGINVKFDTPVYSLLL